MGMSNEEINFASRYLPSEAGHGGLVPAVRTGKLEIRDYFRRTPLIVARLG